MKRGIVDVSSVLWTCLFAGVDKEHGRKELNDAGKEVQINSAIYGYDNVVHHLTTAMSYIRLQPMDLLFVVEGMNSKAGRQYLNPLYKAGRDKTPGMYEEFNKLKEILIATFRNLGSSFVWQDGGVEADDVIAYFAQMLDGERWVISGDKDCAVSVGGNVHHYRNGAVDRNPFGDFAHRLIPTYIALVGDTSDKIPGAKGFGAGAMEKLLDKFGEDGLEIMEGLIVNKQLDRLCEDVGGLKELQKIMDDKAGVYLSYELGRPWINKVNTLRSPLKWLVGMVKSREQCETQELRKFGGVVRIVAAEQYVEALPWIREQICLSPFVSLDVETATPDASDEWLEQQDKADGKTVDVLGSELTSLQLTFGPNLQFTIYLPVNNVQEQGVTNLSVAQVRDVVDMIPRDMITYIQNVAFELPVCYQAWGKDWEADQLHHGFLRNVRCTRIGSSYVDENLSAGLKSRSLDLLGHKQVSYDEVTTKSMLRSNWDGKGRLVREWLEEESGAAFITIQCKMDQLTAREVLNYGADDTICTAALANHYRVIMEIEKTWSVYEEVETYPAYLTALAFVQGTPFSLEDMREMSEEDDLAYDLAWVVLRAYLIKLGFEGTVCPVFTDMTPAVIKEAHRIVLGCELKTMVRTVSKLAKLIELNSQDVEDDDQRAAMGMFALVISGENVGQLNDLVKFHYKGEPVLNLGSPKQMKGLLYDHLNIPVRVINNVTPIEQKTNEPLADAVKLFKKVRAGGVGSLTDEQKILMIQKAKTDDTAIDMAVAFDTDVLDDEARAALKALGTMKSVMTRRSLFYKNWRNAIHWKTGRIHASHNQCAAVTRRYSASFPNDQQLPKKGKAVRFRGCYKPHKKGAVIDSIDYVGQELRLAAEVSQDKNMLACYVGDKLKDIHSITAAGAMRLKWGAADVGFLFDTYGADLARDEEGTYDLFVRLRKIGKAAPIGKRADDLRKDSKNVNFGAQNGAMAAKLAETLIMTFEDAQLFLDARESMFPGVGVAARKAADEAMEFGYAKTLMGARRHLQAAMLSDDRGAMDRAARQAWNAKIQSSAAEMAKLGMSRMWLSNIFYRYDARFIAPIHDELVSSVTREHAVDFLREKHACMAQAYSTMKVPVLGSISIGPDFANQTECGDWFIQSEIEKALVDIFEKEVV